MYTYSDVELGVSGKRVFFSGYTAASIFLPVRCVAGVVSKPTGKGEETVEDGERESA